VPTQNGRHADLKVWKAAHCLYAHVKRLNPDKNHADQERFEPLFNRLEEIARPVLVELCLRPDLTFPDVSGRSKPAT
jgi:hypothetical protein